MSKSADFLPDAAAALVVVAILAMLFALSYKAWSWALS